MSAEVLVVRYKGVKGGPPAYTAFQKKMRIFFGAQNFSRVGDEFRNAFLILPTPRIAGFLADFELSGLVATCRDSVATKSEKG